MASSISYPSGATIFVSNISVSSLTLGTVSNTEFSYLDGVTSAIQTQINAKAALTGATFQGSSSTSVIVKGGSSQSGNIFEIQDSAASMIFFAEASSLQAGAALFILATSSSNLAASTLGFRASTSSNQKAGVNFGNSNGLYWAIDSLDVWYNAKDVSLTRKSAGVLQIGDGSNNTNGGLYLATLNTTGNMVVGGSLDTVSFTGQSAYQIAMTAALFG